MKRPNIVRDGLLQQVRAGDEIVAQILERQLHALADERERGEVHDPVDTLMLLKQPRDRVSVAQVALNKGCVGRHGLTMTLVEVIEHHDLVAGREQLGRGDAADIAGATGDKYFQISLLYNQAVSSTGIIAILAEL